MSRRREKPEGPVQRILKLLENVRRCGNGWSTWCPAHADHNSSLSVQSWLWSNHRKVPGRPLRPSGDRNEDLAVVEQRDRRTQRNGLGEPGWRNRVKLARDEQHGRIPFYRIEKACRHRCSRPFRASPQRWTDAGVTVVGTVLNHVPVRKVKKLK